MEYEYVDSVTFKSPKIRLVRDGSGQLFVRKSVRVDGLLSEKLAGISCPYIVKFAEFGEDEDGAYVIEEYIEGVTAAERSFTQKQAVKALIELCTALEALHSAKIVHRDIKPSNIIVTADGHIKLIDFDASRIEKTVQDKDTQILGTEGFAPPEQFGFSQTDSRSDIYSFGVTMKRLLGENSAPFIGIIKKCTALDPNDRYDSISGVKTAIRYAMLKRLAAIPAAAVLLLAFTAGFSLLPGNKDPADHTDELLSEGFSHESDILKPNSAPSQSEPAADSSSGGVSSVVSVISDLPHEGSQASQGLQATESSVPPESSQAPQSSQPPEVIPPSQTSNGFYRKVINEYGYYNDECNYVFNDDPTVYGIWQAIGLVKKNDLPDLLKGRTDLIYTEVNTEILNDPAHMWIKRVTLLADGAAAVALPVSVKWTKGYIVLDYTDRNFVCEFFKITVNGTEYLAIEKKTGDYMRSGISDAYYIYENESEPELPKNDPPPNDPVTGDSKITYTTSINSDGYYEEKCDYYFYDDPSVHGSWKITGAVKPDNYDKWESGETAFNKIDDAWIREIDIKSDGKAAINKSMMLKWTKGYLVREQPNIMTVSALYTVTVGGVEYLVIENKNGDYRRTGKITSYFIYTRTNG